MQLDTQPAHEDRARARGLRRTRRHAPCPPVTPTAMPAAPTAVELLALLTRVRSVRVALGELDQTRLYDLRAFKTCWAELAYLHRLAAGGRHGGTVVTSMRQLVAGLAALHPSWTLTDDPWENRDRHHQAVRRRLAALAGTGLIDWRVGLDEDLEQRRTLLQLHPVPELLREELTLATAQLTRWERRYGTPLDTGSRTGISDVNQATAPLSRSERQRRGCDRRRARARTVRQRSISISAPPYGAPTTLENNNPASTNRIELRNAYGLRTRASANGRENSPNEHAAPPWPDKAASNTAGASESDPPGDWQQQLSKRVEGRRAAVELLQHQATQRAIKLAQWDTSRHWPLSRLREAWVVARHGASEAAVHGGRAAGPLAREHTASQWQRRGARDDYLTLRRAVTRYNRHSEARPDGYPAGGLAALLHLGVLARQAGDRNGPMYLAYAIGALDQLSRRMRAARTADSAQRKHAQIERARRRHTPHRSGRIEFRAGAWPAWIVLDTHGLPLLTLDERFEDALVTRPPGPPSASIARDILRDALLLRKGQLPDQLDGRSTMKLRAAGELPPAARRADNIVEELAQLTGRAPRALRKLTAEQLGGMLTRARAMQRRQEQRDDERQRHRPPQDNDERERRQP